MEDDEWQSQKNRRNRKDKKKSNLLNEPTNKRSSISTNYSHSLVAQYKDKFIHKQPDICIPKYVPVGDTENRILRKSIALNLQPAWRIDTIWSCLHEKFCRELDDYKHPNWQSLKGFIHEKYDCKTEDDAVKKVATFYGFVIKVYFLDDNIQPVVHGSAKNQLNLLKIGMNYYLPLVIPTDGRKYTFSKSDKEILMKLCSDECKKSKTSQEIEKEKRKLEKLRKQLYGMETTENDHPVQQNNSKKMYYDIYTEDQIENMSLHLCTLKLLNAHSGKAILVNKSSEHQKKEIDLLSRRNCGFNAFQDDKVLVKINDEKNSTGRVIAVVESHHKPVNSLYICKICQDQGSLMKPIDGSFPKIHVDNEPGRRKYESKLKQKPKSVLHDEQKSVEERERESARYADNMYVSVFEVTVPKNSKKPNFNNPKVIEIDPQTCSKLFIVCYEYWDPFFMYPNGKVVGSLSPTETFQDSFHLISSICNVTPEMDKPTREIDEVKRQVAKLPQVQSVYLPSQAIIFTLDNEETKDMDDALSFHESDGYKVIGVHITDVSKFISSTHQMYDKAMKQFCTFYPPKHLKMRPIHLFDKSISEDLLSLVQGKPRAVVSVLLYFSKGEFPKLEKCTFHEGTIISQHKLNYKNVSKWLKDEDFENVDNNLLFIIKECHSIARQLRHQRLKFSYFVRQCDFVSPEYDYDDNFEGRVLVEEFMLLANEAVAEKIYKHYSAMSLLRIQEAVSDYKEWLDQLSSYMNMEFSAVLKQYCSLLEINPQNQQKHRKLVISRTFFDVFCKYLETGDMDKARNILQYDEFYNDFYFHISDWFHRNTAAVYRCSVKERKANRHFSLSKDVYTHFTSPLRRFTDIIVHRMLKSILNNTDITETLDEKDIDDICTIANKKRHDSKLFERICAPYVYFEAESKRYSFILDCVITKIEIDKISFEHPLLKSSFSSKSIKFANLSLDAVPVQLEQQQETIEECCLKWKKIMFSKYPVSVSTSTNHFVIDNHIYDASLDANAFKLFQEIRRSYLPTIQLADKLRTLKTKFSVVSRDESDRISSDSISLTNSVIQIQLKLFLKNTVRVQFCKFWNNGLLKITPELLILASTFQLCLIHHEDPVYCFVPGGKLKLEFPDVVKEFDTTDQYKKYFEPLIHAESLMEILAEDMAFTLLDVEISWISDMSLITGRRETYGVIKLNRDFCEDRNIVFSDEREEIWDRYEYIIEKGIKSVSGDLLCIRSKKSNWNNYWIGHGEVLNVGKWKADSDSGVTNVIVFMLTQSSFCITSNSEDMKFTIDVYLRSVVSKRQQEAVANIDHHKLLREIILNPDAVNENETDENYKMITIDRKHNLNRDQELASEKAFTKKISLIWGPPGTGKTTVGCILSHGYVKRNENIYNNSEKPENHGVVLYCGPSNDCVNLVSLEMKRRFEDDCPKLLRIFGEQQELVDFPLPGFICKKTDKLTGEMQQISLHYLIRDGNDEYARRLKHFDALFHDILNGVHCQVADGLDNRKRIRIAIKEYKSALREAKKNFISRNKFQMVLCTTSVSATHIMEEFCITQVIIDEAGMCKEPETLIPIFSAEENVKNIVLIGDHKQLRPIILSKVAAKRGLQISLFERYQSLQPDLVTMLRCQYRMHPSICEFPSNYFYNRKLRTFMSHLWSGLQNEEMELYRFKNTFPNENFKSKQACYLRWNGIDYDLVVHYYQNVLKNSNYNAIPNDNWPVRQEKYHCFTRDFIEYPERIVFIHTVGDELVLSVSTTSGNESSRANMAEVETVAYVYEELIKRLSPPRRAPNFVTVMTQYRLQEHRLTVRCKEILKKRGIKSDPLVKTVIRSQGSENDYIIFSTVRSIRNLEDINRKPSPGWERKYLGFITDPNQVNVALTRARKGLIIIGNKELLRVNKMWDRLISDLERRKCVWNNAMALFR